MLLVFRKNFYLFLSSFFLGCGVGGWWLVYKDRDDDENEDYEKRIYLIVVMRLQ